MSCKTDEKRVLYHKVPTTIISSNAEEPNMSPGLITIRILLWLFIKILDILYTPFYVGRWLKKSDKLPEIKNKTLLLSATELAARIRRKELTSEYVLKTYISRIQQVNPIINAVVEDRFRAAIEEAKYADKLVAFGTLTAEELAEKYPLLGVPITVKGSIDVAKMKNTSGMVIRANVVAKSDAVPVRYAKEAGAIPILTSNIPELCMNWETTNKIKGTTKNPYNTTRTVGGSSGGEAGLLSSCCSILGIGSDIAGSLRLPAHFCGIWGHKPSPGAVSYVGHYPGCKNDCEWKAAFTLGPMARYATDLKMFLEIIAEPPMKKTLRLNVPVNIKELRIYYVEDINSLITTTVNRNCLAAIQKVIEHFNKVCHVNCEKVRLPLIKYAPELASLALLDIDDVDNIFEGRGDGFFKEFIKYMFGRSKSVFTTIGYGLLRKLTGYLPRSITETCKERLKELKCEIVNILGDDGVLLMPTFPEEAHYHGDILRKCVNSGYLSIFNALSLPVTNCPVMMTQRGLPVGLQVIGVPNADRITLAVAVEIEKAFGGWQPPRSH